MRRDSALSTSRDTLRRRLIRISSQVDRKGLGRLCVKVVGSQLARDLSQSIGGQANTCLTLLAPPVQGVLACLETALS